MASAKAPPSGNRSAGSLASARSISSRTAGGTSAGSGGGGRLMCASAIATCEAPSNGRDAGQALVADDAEGVDVGGRGDLHALRLLGGEVLRGAHDHAGAGERGGVAGLGDAEVGQLDHAVRADQQVARLDVAVHDAGPVRGRQPVGGLAEHVQRPVDGQRALVVQDRDQRLALDELHDQEGELLGAAVVDGLAVVVDRGDVRVGQRRGVPGLVAEPGEEARVAGVLALAAPWPRRSRSSTRSRAFQTSPMPPVAIGAVIS